MQRSNKEVEKFYSSRIWKKTRETYRIYKHRICERCGGAGRIVHHKKYITIENINDYNITLGFNNLELLCYKCHNEEHLANNNLFDEEGQLIPPTKEG